MATSHHPHPSTEMAACFVASSTFAEQCTRNAFRLAAGLVGVPRSTAISDALLQEPLSNNQQQQQQCEEVRRGHPEDCRRCVLRWFPELSTPPSGSAAPVAARSGRGATEQQRVRAFLAASFFFPERHEPSSCDVVCVEGSGHSAAGIPSLQQLWGVLTAAEQRMVRLAVHQLLAAQPPPPASSS